jgi:hypothetical protein
MSVKLRKADTGVGTTRGVLRMSGLTPAGKTCDDIDSDASHESDVDVSF